MHSVQANPNTTVRIQGARGDRPAAGDYTVDGERFLFVAPTVIEFLLLRLPWP